MNRNFLKESIQINNIYIKNVSVTSGKYNSNNKLSFHTSETAIHQNKAKQTVLA